MDSVPLMQVGGKSLDCVGFIADYPAISEAIDVLGHNSNAPCHLCFFKRYDKSGRGEPMYAYTTRVCSGHPSFIRNEQRLKELRSGELVETELRDLGMEGSSSFESSVRPLHNLNEALAAVRGQVPLTKTGKRVVASIFDPYRSSIIAPDHLFLGITHNVLNAVLKVAPVSMRRVAHVLIRECLEKDFLVHQSEVFNLSNAVVHSMSISAMYSILLVAPCSFRNAVCIYPFSKSRPREERVYNEAVDLLEKFH